MKDKFVFWFCVGCLAAYIVFVPPAAQAGRLQDAEAEQKRYAEVAAFMCGRHFGMVQIASIMHLELSTVAITLDPRCDKYLQQAKEAGYLKKLIPNPPLSCTPSAAPISGRGWALPR